MSVSSRGAQANGGSNTREGQGRAITPDGRYVVFTSDASNLVPGDTNFAEDIFVRDRVGRATTRVSVSSRGAQGNEYSYDGAISGTDGRFVVFTSRASNLVPGGQTARPTSSSAPAEPRIGRAMRGVFSAYDPWAVLLEQLMEAPDGGGAVSQPEQGGTNDQPEPRRPAKKGRRRDKYEYVHGDGYKAEVIVEEGAK